MEHVKRLVLVPEHMVEQRKKPLAAPLATQVNEIDSDMQDIIRRQDIPIDEKAKLYDQNLQRYLTFYDKRMNKPLRVNVTHTDKAEEPQGEQSSEETEPSDEIETDIMDSVPATMKSRARQLIKKLKSNKDLVGWNEQGQMVFKGRSVPSTNIVDLVNDSLRQRKNFNPDGWELFSKVLGHLNVPEGIVRNENRLGIVREYKTKGIPQNLPTTPRVQQEKRKNRRDNINSPYKWLK